jgi:hypothetical protein
MPHCDATITTGILGNPGHHWNTTVFTMVYNGDIALMLKVIREDGFKLVTENGYDREQIDAMVD